MVAKNANLTNKDFMSKSQRVNIEIIALTLIKNHISPPELDHILLKKIFKFTSPYSKKALSPKLKHLPQILIFDTCFHFK